MPCFRPVPVWPGVPPNRQVVYSPTKSYAGARSFLLPCGGCIGCRLSKAQDWATRMHHEAALHDQNSFVTLTYADEHLPEDGSLSLRALQLFNKRLRKSLGDRAVRYFACGEYGDQTWRPHYHLILFGHQFPDLTAWSKSPTGHVLHRSENLERLWPFGHSLVGHVTHQSAAYVARYTLKKITGEPASTYYVRPHPVTGIFYRVVPEFAVMSRRPGIGGDWFNKYASDCFPSDFVIVDGQKHPVPRFYKSKLSDLEGLRVTQLRKSGAASRGTLDSTDARLSTREEAQTLRQKALSRNLGE